MWIFTTLGFFSVVAHRKKPNYVLVRARVLADLNALVRLLPEPRPKIQRTPHADYLFRFVAPKDEVASVVAALADSIDYDNFKNAVAYRQGIERARVYHDVWADLLPLQEDPRITEGALAHGREEEKQID